MGIPIAPGTDLTVLARDLSATHDAVMAGATPTATPDDDVHESWTRARSSGTRPSPDTHNPTSISGTELAERRAHHPVRDAVEKIQTLFSDAADDTAMTMGIFDADGVLLWRGGSSGLLTAADRLHLVEGARWDEESTATTAVGLVVRHQRPTRLFGAEHYNRALHSLYCTAAPIHDRRTGEMVAIAGLAGPAMALQPAATAFTTAIATLGEHEMSTAHLAALAELRSAGTSRLAGIRGPGLLIDDDGWVAEGRGCTQPTRVAAPVDGMRQFIPGLGACVVERLPKGWLVRQVGPSSPVVAELDLRGEPTVTVSGDAEPWHTVLTPRHAEILILLGNAGDHGLNAERLSHLIFGDGGHLVTVRAEMSRLRRAVGALVTSRPYRLAPDVELRVIPDGVIPDSVIPDSVTPDGARAPFDTRLDERQRFLA